MILISNMVRALMDVRLRDGLLGVWGGWEGGVVWFLRALLGGGG